MLQRWNILTLFAKLIVQKKSLNFSNHGYSTVSTSNSVFIIGGNNLDSHIVEFTNNEVWKHAGNLRHGRYGHSSILFGSLIFVIGGRNDPYVPYLI